MPDFKSEIINWVLTCILIVNVNHRPAKCQNCGTAIRKQESEPVIKAKLLFKAGSVNPVAVAGLKRMQ